MQQTETIVNLLPEQIALMDNSRFSLRKDRILQLAENIKERGGVIVPLSVEPLEQPVDGAEYGLIAGNYRRAAVEYLNKAGGSYLLPCVITQVDDAKDRIKTQIAENVERQNMTPMDIGFSIQKLMDMGFSKLEVREMFKRSGGRKGTKVQPASNSFINMMLSFLEFPKNIQNKIHAGEISVDGAYKLSRVFKSRPEKLQEVVTELEMAREAELENEEKEENRLLELERKEQEKAEAVVTLEKELEETAKAKEEAFNKFQELTKKEAQLYGEAKQATSGTVEERAAAEKAFQEAQATTKAALKEAEEKKKAEDKLAAKLQKVKEAAEERKKKLADARKDGKKSEGKKAASGRDVEKAATKVGASSNYTPLKLGEVRDFLRDIACAGNPPKVQAIGKILESVVGGIKTPKQGARELAMVTGEYKEKEKK
jgi:ParB/RepB/Spo0J family partition protein